MLALPPQGWFFSEFHKLRDNTDSSFLASHSNGAQNLGMYLKTHFTAAKMLVPVKSRPEAEGKRKLSRRIPALEKLELSNHFC